MADDAPPTPTAGTGTATVDPPEIEMPAVNGRNLPNDVGRLADARNQLRAQLTTEIEAQLQQATSTQNELKSDIDAAQARITTTQAQIQGLQEQMQVHEAEITRLRGEADPLGTAGLDDQLEANEDLARHQAALRAQQTVLDQLQDRVAQTTSAMTDAQTRVKAVEDGWAEKRQGFEEAERQLDRVDEKVLILGDERAALEAATMADATATELDESDPVEAANHRAIAAQHRADAAVKAAEAAAIDVDPQQLVDAGLDIPVAPTTDPSVAEDPPLSDDETGADPTDPTDPTTDPPLGEDLPSSDDSRSSGDSPGTDTTDPDAATATASGEIQMEGEVAGTSPEGAALAAEAAQLRETMLSRLANEHAELEHRYDLSSDQVVAAQAVVKLTEADVKDFQARGQQIDDEERPLWQKLSEMDEAADPAAYQEVLEDVQVHIAAQQRQQNLIEQRSADLARAKAEVARLEPVRDADLAEANAFGGSLRSAEGEIDVMERRAAALDERYRGETNARNFTDLAAKASAGGDQAEAQRLRARATQELDRANAAGSVLDANPLTPTIIDDAGLRDTPGAVSEVDDDTTAVDPAGDNDATNPTVGTDPTDATDDGTTGDDGVGATDLPSTDELVGTAGATVDDASTNLGDPDTTDGASTNPTDGTADSDDVVDPGDTGAGSDAGTHSDDVNPHVGTTPEDAGLGSDSNGLDTGVLDDPTDDLDQSPPADDLPDLGTDLGGGDGDFGGGDGDFEPEPEPEPEADVDNVGTDDWG